MVILGGRIFYGLARGMRKALFVPLDRPTLQVDKTPLLLYQARDANFYIYAPVFDNSLNVCLSHHYLREIGPGDFQKRVARWVKVTLC